LEGKVEQQEAVSALILLFIFALCKFYEKYTLKIFQFNHFLRECEIQISKF